MTHHRLGALVALLGLPLACTMGTSSTGPDSQNPPQTPAQAQTAPAQGPVVGIRADAFTVRTDIRALYVDEAQWTRSYLVAALSHTANEAFLEARLNNAEIALANSFEPYVGPSTTTRLAQLLALRVTGLAAIVATMRGNATSTSTARAEWFTNADLFATTLASTNTSWSLVDLETKLHNELTHTLAQIDARNASNWDGDADEWSATRDSALSVGDTITNEIVVGYSDAVQPAQLPPQEQAVVLMLRPVLEDTAFWTRQMIASHAANLGDEQTAIARLTRTVVDAKPAFDLTFGESASANIQSALQVMINDSLAYASATTSSEQNTVRTQWFQDSEKAAEAFADTPELGHLSQIMGVRTLTTAAEIDAQAISDFATEAAHYDIAVANERALADLVASFVPPPVQPTAPASLRF